MTRLVVIDQADGNWSTNIFIYISLFAASLCVLVC